ncbi:SulA-like leucine-rich domain-containing protein [Psychromonas ossibalaenae]|uniref:SulA-like leucine-rich domain-containing protein n=1 Tax=Psychromonas ossibalaenae TaxID=444922 RepID=UPI00037558F4|nr:SulA-like leucine-rich domain-containing protein [Psychromonas ossibalaenae]
MLSDYVQAKNSTFSLTELYAKAINKQFVNISYEQQNFHDLLTHLNQDNDPRWILFIAPPGRPNFRFLQQAGIDKSRVITLDASKVKDTTEMLKSTLKSNNYATVISWLNDLDNDLQTELETYSRSSETDCFVYCKQ